MKLKLDLHDIYNRGDEIERALRGIIDEAIEKKAPLVEIIPGKGSGQLKKRVLRFLERSVRQGRLAATPGRPAAGTTGTTGASGVQDPLGRGRRPSRRAQR